MATSPQDGDSRPRTGPEALRSSAATTLFLPPPAPTRRDPSLVPFLSIMLLVLAFFIILTSKASFDAEKSRAVTESLQRQFAGAQENVVGGPQGGPLAPEARDVLRNILVKFQGLVPLDGRVRQLSSLEQAIQLPTDLFFAADSAEVLASRRSLIAEVMRAIDLRPADWDYELEILVQGDPPGTLTLGRAANLAATLAGEGGAQSGIVVALARGDPDWMVLLVRLRPGLPPETQEAAP